jgi:hypothetical protein
MARMTPETPKLNVNVGIIMEKSNNGIEFFLEYKQHGSCVYIGKDMKFINKMIMDLFHLKRLGHFTKNIFLEYDEIVEKWDDKPKEGFYLFMANRGKLFNDIINNEEYINLMIELLCYSCNYNDDKWKKKFDIIGGIVDKEWDNAMA